MNVSVHERVQCRTSGEASPEKLITEPSLGQRAASSWPGKGIGMSVPGRGNRMCKATAQRQRSPVFSQGDLRGLHLGAWRKLHFHFLPQVIGDGQAMYQIPLMWLGFSQHGGWVLRGSVCGGGIQRASLSRGRLSREASWPWLA